MKKILLIIIFAFTFVGAKAQEVSCEDLKNFIESKGTQQVEVYSLTLNSSWLQNVKLYKYDNKYYVIAAIKKNKYDIYNTKSYIFCNIPYSNWTSFHTFDLYGESTYGERFHKYIKDYICNCY